MRVMPQVYDGRRPPTKESGDTPASDASEATSETTNEHKPTSHASDTTSEPTNQCTHQRGQPAHVGERANQRAPRAHARRHESDKRPNRGAGHAPGLSPVGAVARVMPKVEDRNRGTC